MAGFFRNISCICLLVLSLQFKLFAQQYYLSYKLPEAHPAHAFFKSEEQSFADSLSMIKAVRGKIILLHAEAYLLASLDSITGVAPHYNAWVNPGLAFKWASLRQGNAEELVIDKVGYREKFYREKPFRISELQKLEKDIIRFLENDGYPFAQVKLDSVEVKNNTIEASLNVDKGPLILFDTLIVLGSAKVKNRFLLRYLRLEKGQPFSQERIEDMTSLLSQLSYIKLSAPPAIEIFSGKAAVYLTIADRRSNQVDGILGFLPNSNNDGKLLVTGEANLGIKNLFGTGKLFDLEWRRYNQLSQTLKLGYIHPCLFGSPLDLTVNFDLIKQDTSFLNVDRFLALGLHATSNSVVSLSARYRTSSQLAVAYNADTSRLINSDYSILEYGLSWKQYHLDDIVVPMRGWQLLVGGSAGEKRIKKKDNIPSEVYDGVQLNSVQYSFQFTGEVYSKLGKKSVLYSRVRAAHIANNANNLFMNDLYRLGGLKTFRGFNEWYFYASSYAVATTEYRFYTEPGSYLLVFADFGALQNALLPSNKGDLPVGLGAGLSLTTKAGIFSFVYALGKSQDQPFAFNQSKIHFGLVSRF